MPSGKKHTQNLHNHTSLKNMLPHCYTRKGLLMQTWESRFWCNPDIVKTAAPARTHPFQIQELVKMRQHRIHTKMLQERRKWLETCRWWVSVGRKVFPQNRCEYEQTHGHSEILKTHFAKRTWVKNVKLTGRDGATGWQKLGAKHKRERKNSIYKIKSALETAQRKAEAAKNLVSHERGKWTEWKEHKQRLEYLW